jgi:hypothetical protein
MKYGPESSYPDTQCGGGLGGGGRRERPPPMKPEIQNLLEIISKICVMNPELISTEFRQNVKCGFHLAGFVFV